MKAPKKVPSISSINKGIHKLTSDPRVPKSKVGDIQVGRNSSIKTDTPKGVKMKMGRPTNDKIKLPPKAIRKNSPSYL